MKEPKDKRTKAYKDWKKKFDAKNKNKSEGLGDTIEKITEATGIKKAVKFLAGEDCGCDERKDKLNKLFSYNKMECLTEEEYLFLDDLFKATEKLLLQTWLLNALIFTIEFLMINKKQQAVVLAL